MTRLARVVAVGLPRHVTQRGNARQYILHSDADRTVYLDLLRQNIEQHNLALIGYCLMSNHVHLITVPPKASVLGLALKDTHGRYASYWNAIHHSRGHVWEGRYYSCPLDETHLWKALRYTELNPVRAGLVAKAESWAWSSATAHCATLPADGYLAMEQWQTRWSPCSWRGYLSAGENESELSAIRQCTHAGRPLGAAEFIGALEQQTQRHLAPQRRGRLRKTTADERQIDLSFAP